MDQIVKALRAEQAALAAMVDPLDHEGLARPSRCPGWSVADVLLHLAQTNEIAVASVEGRFGEAATATVAQSQDRFVDAPEQSGPPRLNSVDDWAGAAVAAERTIDLDAVRARWAASAEAQAAAFASCDPRARVQWVAGEMAARTLATTRFTETWIHTGDVADGLGIAHEPTDRIRHIARLAHRTIPYAFASSGRELAGAVRFELRAPSGEQWTFGDEPATTIIRGEAIELCDVAGQRRNAADTQLTGEGPDAAAVLALVRTFA